MDREAWVKSNIIPAIVKTGRLNINDKVPEVINVQLRSPAETKGVMLSTLFFVKVTLQSEGSAKDVNIILKLTPPDKAFCDMAGMGVMFSNEITAYEECVRDIGLQEMFPKCFYSDLRDGYDCAIALEDLSDGGYKMAESKSELDSKHIELAVKTLGKLHGHCYALKEQHPGAFKALIAKFRESRYLDTMRLDKFERLMYYAPRRATEYLREHGLASEQFLLGIEERFRNAFEYGKSVVAPTEPLAVICHGDYTRNNVMFKYEDNAPVDMKVIDLQTLRYASPAIDLSVMLFLHTRPEVLRKGWDRIFGAYHEQVVAALCQKLQTDRGSLPDYYSLESMGKDFVKYCIHGFHIATFYLPILIEPMDIELSEYAQMDIPIEEEIAMIYTRGGNELTKSLADVLLFVTELAKKYGSDIFDGAAEVK